MQLKCCNLLSSQVSWDRCENINLINNNRSTSCHSFMSKPLPEPPISHFTDIFLKTSCATSSPKNASFLASSTRLLYSLFIFLFLIGRNFTTTTTTVLLLLLGSLRNHDGYGDENVTSKYRFELIQVFRDYSVLFILYNMSEVSYNWIGTDGFEVKNQTERFTVVCPRCRQNIKFGNFT